MDEALKQINAAQYFLGSRLLKQAQEKNDTAGMMRATMMMFPQHPQVGVNVLKTLMPPVPKPENQLAREKFEFTKKQPIHVGESLYKIDENGNPVQLVAPPDKPLPFAISRDLLGKDKTIRVTPQAFAEQLSTLPPYAQTNAANIAQLRASGFGTNGMRLKPSTAPTTPPEIQPLPKSKDQLKKGVRYSTARGEATWNGEKFVQ